MTLTTRRAGQVAKITVTTGGAGYTSLPSVQLSGGGGQFASGHACLAGTRVDSIFLTTGGTGYTGNPTVTIVGGGGTGAAASAYAHTSTLLPVSFFQGRYGDLYGVDGSGRGFRWDGAATTAQPIGLNKPQLAPGITASTASASHVAGIQLINEGAGYFAAPSVSFTGGGGTGAAATAQVFNGRVISLRVTDPGSGYTGTPTVQFAGGIGSGVTLGVTVKGGVDSVEITDRGSAYSATAGATIDFGTNSNAGLTGAAAVVSIDQDGGIGSVTVLASGTGATTTGVTGIVTAATGSGAVVNVRMAYSIDSVTATSGGTGFFVPPIITVLPAPGDDEGGGGVVTCNVSDGVVQSPLTVLAGGRYLIPPTATVLDTKAEAMATIGPAMSGEYKCCFRYIDDTPTSQSGPRASSISDIQTVTGSHGTYQWSFNTTNADDRATAAELWRTTAGQSVLFFRVATVQRADWTSGYTDTLTDEQLRDPTRPGYAMMPLTLPSGQINARRFEVPPPEFAVAVMFQDRAWYAVDTSGERPNALLYSEIDEPESVSQANELILQENIADSDRIVALVPFASQLLIAQQAHIYALQYVAQPVIDASLRLVAYRGIINSACWDVMGGVAFIADSYGMYAFDGQSEQAISTAVDNYWRDGIIDFTKADKFHVAADLQSRVVKFYYCRSTDTEPVRALCYCMATKSWWEEEYPVAITANCPALIQGRMAELVGTAGGSILKPSGTNDSGTAVDYRYRSGELPLSLKGDSRSVSLVYDPTTADSTLGVSLFYNGATAARPNAIASDRGSGFVTTQGSTVAALNLKSTRSPLGEATGYARAYYSGRVDDRSAGADRHIALGFSGQQTTDPVVVHAVGVEGVG